MAGKTHTTFVSLGRSIRAYGETIETETNKAKITLAKGVAFDVLKATPVDVGTARSNWIPKLNAPPQHKRLAFSPGSHLGTGESANFQRAYDNVANVFNLAKPGDSLYLKNNLNYITRLNQGYSKQAPAGFVEAAIVRRLNDLRRIRILA